jgi:hypothetical protein
MIPKPKVGGFESLQDRHFPSGFDVNQNFWLFFGS